MHHNWIGGLIEHVLSLCQLAKFAAAHYPGIDFDLLLAGVMLHDLGKIHELSYTRSFAYTNAGPTAGPHRDRRAHGGGEDRGRCPDFPAPLHDLLLHMILSHHGQLDYGSPKIPLFPEALLLHLLDTVDSKMECMRALIAHDSCGGWRLDRIQLRARTQRAEEGQIPGGYRRAQAFGSATCASAQTSAGTPRRTGLGVFG